MLQQALTCCIWAPGGSTCSGGSFWKLHAAAKPKPLPFGTLQVGHAAAAAAEGVPLHHAAAFLALLLPGAWVALEEGALSALAPHRQLRVPHPAHTTSMLQAAPCLFHSCRHCVC